MNALNPSVLLARDVLSALDAAPDLKMPKALKARALMAAVPHIPTVRSHFAPNFGSDLGVRISTDPQDFLGPALQAMQIEQPTHSAAMAADFAAAWESDKLTESEFVANMDTLISFAGQWAAASEIAARVVTSTKRPTTYRAWTYLGAAAVASGSNYAGELYREASVSSDATAASTAMSVIRGAAWAIKRNQDEVGGRKMLDALLMDVSDWAHENRISEADRDVLSAVALNLRALVAVRSKDVEAAMSDLDRAKSLIEADGVVVVGDNERRRYRAQITVNMTQLFCKQNSLSNASDSMRTLTDWTRTNHPESLSEALTVCGYVSYLQSNYEESERDLREATHLIADEGAPSRLLVARKIRAVSLAKLGKHEEAEALVLAAEMDPIGLSELNGAL